MSFDYKGLRIKMAEKNIQWTNIHKEANVSWASIANMNKGKSVTLDTLGKIARYLNCDIGDLVSIKPEQR